MRIYSERGYLDYASWHVVYEWEDKWSEKMNAEIVNIPNGLSQKIGRRIRLYTHRAFPEKVWRYTIKDKALLGIMLIMDAEGYYLLPTKNVIPVFLDFTPAMVDKIIAATQDLPIFFVTSMYICNMLKEKGCDKVRYMPLCVSDKYYGDKSFVDDKSVDIIQIGRKNAILHEYALKYCEEHPEVEYIYQEQGGSQQYTSTIRGDVGGLETRDKYIDLVKKAKVSLVSTPGCDKGRTEFGQLDFVTPRFYESAACYCRMLGRYTNNQETDYLKLGSVCPNIFNYDEFSKYLDEYLSAESKIDYDVFDSFVGENLASKRAGFIEAELSGVL